MTFTDAEGNLGHANLRIMSPEEEAKFQEEVKAVGRLFESEAEYNVAAIQKMTPMTKGERKEALHNLLEMLESYEKGGHEGLETFLCKFFPGTKPTPKPPEDPMAKEYEKMLPKHLQRPKA